MKRRNFSDKQRAIIYARDRATCAFSTKSLWALDYGIIPGWVVDWVDHVLPCSMGGSNDLENGVCASNFFNSKKRCNIDENNYFVREGALTQHYIDLFGRPPVSLVNQLERLKNIEPADWYFNRAIVDLFVGFEVRCDKEFKAKDWRRNDAYWFDAAWKRLRKFHEQKTSLSIADRSLVKDRSTFGLDDLLPLELIDSRSQFDDLLEHLYQSFRENYQAVFRYHQLKTVREQTAFLWQLENNNKINPIVFHTLKGNNFLNTETFQSSAKL